MLVRTKKSETCFLNNAVCFQTKTEESLENERETKMTEIKERNDFYKILAVLKGIKKSCRI